MQDAKQLLHLVEKSDKILITAHLGTDADSLCSSVLLKQILELNYPEKTVAVCLEDEASNLNFVAGYDEVEFGPLSSAIATKKPDLIIMLDANNFARCSRQADIKSSFDTSEAKLVIIDHHEPLDKDEADVYINNQSPAVTFDIYKLFLDAMGLKRPPNYAQTTLLGIYTDTGGFTYAVKDYRGLFDVVAQLIDDGANLEQIKSKLNRFSLDEVKLLSELTANMQTGPDYSYSFVSDSFSDQWLKEGKDTESYHNAKEYFVNGFIRNIDNRQWGFIVYRDIQSPPGTYSASFRAVGDIKDVAALAAQLGGGGHKPAAGAKFEAKNLNDALEKVKAVIVK